MREYVGIVERNDWEGETFGYYWPRTEDSERALRGVLARYVSEGESSLRVEILGLAEMTSLDDRDRNGYMRRVSVFRAPLDWTAFIEQIAPADAEIASEDAHPFYKGRGIPSEMRDRDWRGSAA